MSGNQHIQDDHDLIRRIRGGDKHAFEILYRTYFFDLCDFTHRYIRLPAVCEELVQDLFLNIWRRKEKLDPKGSCRSYLYKSARNRAFDYLKHLEVQREYLKTHTLEKQSEWEAIKSDMQPQFSDEAIADLELSEAISEAIARLPEQRKMIFLLSREDGLTYREIADVLNISVKTVETQMGRSLATLRKLLSGYLPAFAVLTGSMHSIL